MPAVFASLRSLGMRRAIALPVEMQADWVLIDELKP
ncbi:hypothetical protein NIES3275_32090 [Microchaete diplosiphon NIES-3275]|nr:hypothetical protein NIES3275_32090 [Microchaete diplosiphon NIES-3275]